MDTIRARLTAWYGAALALTLVTIAAPLYVAARGALVAALDHRLRSEADLAAGILVETYRTGGLLVQRDSAGQPVLTPSLNAVLQALPDYLMITHREGRVLFASPAAGPNVQVFDRLAALMAAPGGAGGAPGTASLGPGGPTIRYIVRPVPGAGPEIGAVLTGTSTAAVRAGLEQLVSVLLLVVPLGFIAAIAVGSWVAGRALEPLDRITTEVREITDGRSLHRRLAVPMVKDEFGRLAETLNQMLARLEASFTALRRFTADASHELKTPLTVLRAGVERAVTSPRTPAEMLPLMEETLQEINRMTELVDALLTLARADEGRAELHRESVDLRVIVEEAQETGELLAERSGVTIDVATPAQPVLLEVDRSRVRQLILNLVENAVKYTPRGGSVSVRLAAGDGRVALSVADTGIGIAPGDLPHIFDRFWRADTARTRTGERAGTGLGLAICKWIAEAHGGAIDVQSRPGRGTVFTVTLPGGQAPRRTDG
ncbi:MAG: sensor histidine kinase [Gemmatimonadales bacterium]